MKRLLFCAVALASLGLAQADEAPSTVPFRVGKKKAVILPVKVADTDAEFQLNTGLGFNVISPALAQKLGVTVSPDRKVKPVTGGELNLAQARVSSLAVGNIKEGEQEVVVAEPRTFVGNDGETKVDGILSLAFFREHPFTLDYTNGKIILENSESLRARKAAGTKVECRMADEAVVAMVQLALKEKAPDPEKPGGLAGFLSNFTGGGGSPEPPKAWMQVDTGCDSMLLDSKMMFTLKVDATGANVTETEPTDQNGLRYRAWTGQMGKVGLWDTPLGQEKSPVVFRKLVQAEGVLGQAFLSKYPALTFDLPGNELIVSK